ncbi:MAG: hypothetical protein GF331_15835 [Chitinivibrionales bacterium]|nr:hypothetical protein [Chitinivibrionales bacterium]
MKRFGLVACGILVLALSAWSAPRKEMEAQQKELELLKSYLEQARDSLQREITDRWRLKQRYVEQRELDKEKLEELRGKQEQAFAELGQMKEEVFARERLLEDSRKGLAEAREQWDYVATSFGEVFDKEAKQIADAFPLDMEWRREELEEIRRQFSTDKKPAVGLEQLLDYHGKLFDIEDNAGIVKHTVMPDDGELQEMTVVRFGTLFGYALSNSGDPHVIRQTGKLGSERYAVEQIGSDDLAAYVQQKVPVWDRENSFGEPVTVDVMQNSNSALLISGKNVTLWTRAVQWFKEGGPVLIPLVLLCLWALVLVVLKALQFRSKYKSIRDYYETVVGHLKKNEPEKALAFARTHKGVVAKVVVTCLEHSKWNRASAEKAVREILVEESPQLNKHLATLAVIAGAAPLLGLLGTVTGMITLFEVITHYGTSDPKILAGGISEALITTQAGLSVAIPILLVHNWLRNQSLHIHAEMEKHAIRILNRLWPET